MSAPALVEHYFRHEYGRLVATLSRRFGVQQIEAVEDAAQAALLAALESWPIRGQPDDPSAWLYRVAHNRLVGELRRSGRRRRILAQASVTPTLPPQNEPATVLPGEIRDDLLRMLFVCCDEALPVESRLVLALKTLCGFDVREIALRLFTREAGVYKRLSRARARLREHPLRLETLSAAACSSRLPSVHAVLYLLFTEGHLSTRADASIRRELCDEAIRLATLLAEHPAGQTPETFALLALMHLHAARLDARRDGAGALLLLDEQNRDAWDLEQIQLGMRWLAASAQGQTFSRYHAEAGIAAEHCLASSLTQTRWDRVVECYALLERLAPSPLHRLGRAVAVAEGQGPHAGLAVLEGFVPPTWLEGSYQWSAVLADLHRRCGHHEHARRHRELALELAPTPAIRALLERRLRPGS